jgi:hypothetical protein
MKMVLIQIAMWVSVLAFFGVALMVAFRGNDDDDA